MNEYCRLCGGDGQSENLRRCGELHSTNICKYFKLQFDHAKSVCDVCLAFVKKIHAFDQHCHRVNKMFSDLEAGAVDPPLDWDEIRSYYGVDTSFDWKPSDAVKLDHGTDILEFLFENPETIAESDKCDVYEIVVDNNDDTDCSGSENQYELKPKSNNEVDHSKSAASSDSSDSSSDWSGTSADRESTRKLLKRKKGRPKKTISPTILTPDNARSKLNVQRRAKQTFPCDLCGKHLQSNYALHTHKQSHSSVRPFQCKDCGKTFGRSDVLRNHMVIHTGQKPFVCDECGRNFTRSADLKSHQRIHNEAKPFVCSECGRGFKRAGDLKSHQGTHVRKEKFECSLCPKKFLSLGGLQYHLKIHTGEKPYTCPIAKCNMCFRQSGNRSKHMKIHH